MSMPVTKSVPTTRMADLVRGFLDNFGNRASDVAEEQLAAAGGTAREAWAAIVREIEANR